MWFALTIQAIKHISIRRVGLVPIEKLFGLFVVKSSDFLIHIPEKWSAKLESCDETYFSSDDCPGAFMDDTREFGEREERE
jgi:hypothetical protein